jgi:lactoylglutathione lyase
MLSCERYALPTVHVHHSWMLSQLLRKRDIPDEKYTNAFLGFGPEDKNFAVELTYNYGVESYDIGAGFGHFGIALPLAAAESDTAAAAKLAVQVYCLSSPCRAVLAMIPCQC